MADSEVQVPVASNLPSSDGATSPMVSISSRLRCLNDFRQSTVMIFVAVGQQDKGQVFEWTS
jgi:hypothetical protein